MTARGAGGGQTKSGTWRRRLIGGLLGAGLAVALPSLGWAQNVFSVDNPQEGDVVSGNVAVNGFHCEAAEEGILVGFNGAAPNPIGLTERADALLPAGSCDDLNDGFVFNFLWGLLAPGPHSLEFYLGSATEPFATRNVTVVQVADPSAFLANASGECVGTLTGPDDFSTNFRAAWFQGLQNVSIVETGVEGEETCPEDMAAVGPVCVDTYEASVWESADGTGTQYGADSDDYPCEDDGQDCDNIFAVSRAEVTPSTQITWFQAQQACRNAGKRLLTNAEWQAAAAGTPDPGESPGPEGCNTSADQVFPTGEQEDCVSRWEVFDMVGNVWEWVADWVPRSTACGAWPASIPGGDFQCLAGAATDDQPSALIRGGSFNGGASAGVFAVNGGNGPSLAFRVVGFRCAR